MLDINFIRDNKDLVKDAVQKKHIDIDIEKLISLDEKRRTLLKSIEEKRQEQNEASKKISQVKDENERKEFIAKMSVVKAHLQTEEDKLKPLLVEWQRLMLSVPNIPDMSVPEGNDDSGNKEVRTWGTIPEFSFTPKNHVELMNALNMIDLERGAQVAGFRGYYLRGWGARLSFALWQFVLDKMVGKGFEPMVVPSLVKKEPFVGTGYLPQGEEDLYKTQDDLYLAGTGEVATMGYFMDTTFAAEELPKKVIAFSPCFRREAGSHGKDTKGIFRIHEFMKLEQVVICEASHQTSVDFHEALTTNAEEILQALNLPYHVVVNCGGDLGLGQVKKYDLEAWVPSEGRYRETHSSSYFHDFQTRRLNIRYTDAAGKKQYAHSLNNTAIATPRILVALVENNQQADGSVTIPQVLRPYLGGQDAIRKAA